MGNENKVDSNEIILKTREFFKDGLIDSTTAGQMYSLAEEYARTKQAKQFLVYLSVILFIGALVLTTMLLSMRIQGSREIDFEIADFKTVDLNELLTTSKRNEGKLRGLRQEIDELRRQQAEEIRMIRTRTRGQIRLLQTMNLGTEERKRRENALKRQENARIAAIRGMYQKKLAPKVEESERIRKQMAHSRKKIAKTQTAINNFQQLWEIEEKKIRQEYVVRIQHIQQEHRRQMDAYERFHKKYVASLILKYNPVFKSEDLKGILESTQGRPGVAPSSWVSLLGSEKVLPHEDYTELTSRIREDFKLIRRLRQVHYTNSVAPALKRVDALTALIIYSYDTLWNKLVRTVDGKNRLISKHRNALAAYAARTREHGYIVNADDANSVIVVMNRDYPVSPGTEGIVIRGERRKVATIRFIRAEDGQHARVLSTISNATILPLDKVLIKIQ